MMKAPQAVILKRIQKRLVLWFLFSIVFSIIIYTNYYVVYNIFTLCTKTNKILSIISYEILCHFISLLINISVVYNAISASASGLYGTTAIQRYSNVFSAMSKISTNVIISLIAGSISGLYQVYISHTDSMFGHLVISFDPSNHSVTNTGWIALVFSSIIAVYIYLTLVDPITSYGCYLEKSNHSMKNFVIRWLTNDSRNSLRTSWATLARQGRNSSFVRVSFRIATIALRNGVYIGIKLATFAAVCCSLLRVGVALQCLWVECYVSSSPVQSCQTIFDYSALNCEGVKGFILQSPMVLFHLVRNGLISRLFSDFLIGFLNSSIILIELTGINYALCFLLVQPLDFCKIKNLNLLSQESYHHSEDLLINALSIGTPNVATSSKPTFEKSDKRSVRRFSLHESEWRQICERQYVRYSQLLQETIAHGKTRHISNYSVDPIEVPYFSLYGKSFRNDKKGDMININDRNLSYNDNDDSGMLNGINGLLLVRSLALHDLNILVRTCPARRRKLFNSPQSNQAWDEIVAALLTFIDALALQLIVLEHYLHFETIFPLTKPIKVQSKEQISDKSQNNANPKSTTYQNSKESNKITSVEVVMNSITRKPRNNEGDVRNGNTASGTINGAIKRRYLMFLNQIRGYVNSLTSHEVVGAFSGYFHRSVRQMFGLPIPGKGVRFGADLPYNAFPPMLASNAVCAIESLSLLLQFALSEDTSGASQHSVCAAAYSLLHLEHAHRKFCKMMNESRTVNIRTVAGQVQHIKFRTSAIAELPISLQRIGCVIDEALNRLVNDYRDVLSMQILSNETRQRNVANNPSRTDNSAYDNDLYSSRYLVENLISRLSD